jgi:hypothetical protein
MQTNGLRNTFQRNFSLEQGVPVEDVQYLVVHSDPRTTRLYGRREQKVSKNLGGEDFD